MVALGRLAAVGVVNYEPQPERKSYPTPLRTRQSSVVVVDGDGEGNDRSALR